MIKNSFQELRIRDVEEVIVIFAALNYTIHEYKSNWRTKLFLLKRNDMTTLITPPSHRSCVYKCRSCLICNNLVNIYSTMLNIFLSQWNPVWPATNSTKHDLVYE